VSSTLVRIGRRCVTEAVGFAVRGGQCLFERSVVGLEFCDFARPG
jgi:hypothetical protein